MKERHLHYRGIWLELVRQPVVVWKRVVLQLLAVMQPVIYWILLWFSNLKVSYTSISHINVKVEYICVSDNSAVLLTHSFSQCRLVFTGLNLWKHVIKSTTLISIHERFDTRITYLLVHLFNITYLFIHPLVPEETLR